MAKRSATSLHWLTLAVVLPLCVLAALAISGIRSQWRVKRSLLLDEAKARAESTARIFAEFAQHRIEILPVYPDPPVPGEASAMDSILDGIDPGALLALRNNPDAGNSPAGLPRRVLAALRLLELDPSAQQPDEVVDLVTRECPSVFTATALQRLGSPSGWSAANQWSRADEVRRLAASHAVGGWLRDKGRLAWLEPAPDSIRFISADNVDSAFGSVTIESDPLRFQLSTNSTEPQTQEAPWLLASAPVPLGEGLRVEVSLKSPEAHLRDLRQRILRDTALLAIAACVSLGGLYLIHRTLRRERQLNDMKSQFVASVSHELRAPVASIRLMADALEAEKVAPATAKEFHRLIAREGARLSTLVGNVLDHARIEQGRRVWKMEPCDLESLVADTLRVMEPLAQEKSITLRSALSPVEASVDAGAIQQALVNLLDNAIKFSPPVSTVVTTLAIDDERRTWKLSVRDEGPGVPKDEQSRIFERFYRPGDELRRETQGTGIGLNLVKAIAEAHGGTVSVMSEPGRGSVFKLAVPHGTAGPQTGSKQSDCRSEDRRSREA